MNLPRLQRLNYIYLSLMLWFIFPVLLSSILNMFGVGTMNASFTSTNLSTGANTSKFASSWDMAYFLLFIIPMHFVLTFRRIKDLGWHKALTVLMGLPFINLILWVWPGDETDNEWGLLPEPARRGVKIFIFGFPLWIIIIFMLAGKFNMITAGMY